MKTIEIMQVLCVSDFDKGVNEFTNGKPVKVLKALKDEFNKALSKHFINMEVDGWETTIVPLKLHYKFKGGILNQPINTK